MNPRSPLLVVFALLASAAAVVFLAISIDSHIYTPGLGRIEYHLGVSDTIAAHVGGLNEDFSTVWIVRKLYSVGAFAVVGLLASPLFARTGRVRSGAILVTGFSLAIEIFQRAISHVSHETNVSSLFDLGCGAVGGAIGAVAWNLAVDARRPRGSEPPSSK